MRIRALLLSMSCVVLLLGCSKKDPSPPGEQGHGAEDHGHERHTELVRLTPEAARNAGLQLAEARRKSLSAGLTVPARITYRQRGVAKVAARVPGLITRIDVELGQEVAQGQVLGKVESPELAQARADFLATATKTRVAQGNFHREQELLQKGITSEREMREAESTFVTAQAEMNAAEARLHTLGLTDAEIGALKQGEHYTAIFSLRSPLKGTVTEILGTEGQTVEATTPLFTVGDLTQLWALLDVYEAQLPRLREGQPVVLTLQALPAQRFSGRIEYIGDVVDEETRAITVRVAVPNPDGLLKPGMFATAEIALSESAGDGGTEGPQPLIVPREAVQKIGSEHVLFVPAGENQFKPVEVHTGAVSSQEVEILSGIEPGTRIVTQGSFVLKSELSKESLGGGHSH